MPLKKGALDLSDSMRKIVRTAFPESQPCGMDRFHIQKLACDAVQELRIRSSAMFGCHTAGQ